MGHDLSAFADRAEPVAANPSLSADGERPWVTVHYAQTLDGRIATRTGNSQWVSGEESLQLAHRLRAEHDAVLVGVGTVLEDNPKLTVRHVPGRNPVRVVLDSSLKLPIESALLTDGAATTIVITTRRASRAQVAAVAGAGGLVLVVPDDGDGRVDLRFALHRLHGLGVRSVLIEGGSAVITSALRSGLADRLVVCIAPKVVGTGIEAVGDLGIRRLTEATAFDGASFRQLGEDVIFEGRIQQDIEPRAKASW
jgi:riboflavin-specific deaminase-like protein